MNARHALLFSLFDTQGALEAEVDETSERIVSVSYQPGDVSFHHGCMLHYSGASKRLSPV
jgi:hypothetical protein